MYKRQEAHPVKNSAAARHSAAMRFACLDVYKRQGHIQFADVALPLLWNLGAVALGLALAVLLRWLAGQGHSLKTSNQLTIWILISKKRRCENNCFIQAKIRKIRLEIRFP